MNGKNNTKNNTKWKNNVELIELTFMELEKYSPPLRSFSQQKTRNSCVN